MLKVCEVIDETSFAFVTFDEDERFLFKEWCKEAKKALKKKEIIGFIVVDGERTKIRGDVNKIIEVLDSMGFLGFIRDDFLNDIRRELN